MLCIKNDYCGYGCAFTLNSSKQFWTRGTSKPWTFAGANPGGAIEAIAPPKSMGIAPP